MPLNKVAVLGLDGNGVTSVLAAPNGSLYDTVTGKASYTGGNLSGGKCMLSTYKLPEGVFGTALSAKVWDTSYHCGECVKVSNSKGKSVTAMLTTRANRNTPLSQIVDICTPCEATRLNLFQDAFAQLADLSQGIIDVAYTYVPCGISGTPLRLRNKEGTSAWWFSMQVLGADVPVASLEVSVDDGRTWRPTTRQEYNFFEEPRGFGKDTVSVRVTGETGRSVVVPGVGMEPGLETTASGNV
ncbi:hypothetical protein PG990_007131 [Apiospora arundinis]